MLKIAQIVFFAFAALLLIGGYAGYAEKKSMMSLMAGALCGGLALAGALLVTSRPGLALGLVIAGSILAAGGMMPRLRTAEGGFKVWPAGTVFVASLVTLGVAVGTLATNRGGGAGAAPGAPPSVQP